MTDTNRRPWWASVQGLFLVTIVLKIISSALGWLLGSPWILGFAVPLALMSAYIALGARRAAGDVTDEKFADSCYYLGFIFTITSIIFSLFDLPHIQENLSSIAVRFGAAMLSTVIGLIVRVYLVSFKREAQDLPQDIEQLLIDSANTFRTHLQITIERLQDFESTVDTATKEALTRVQLAIEQAAVNYSEQFSTVFHEIADHNKKAADDSTAYLKRVSDDLASTLTRYSGALEGNMSDFQKTLDQFASLLNDRLKQITFPDDYFVATLKSPLDQLATNVNALVSDTASMSESLRTNTKKVNTSLTNVSKSADKISTTMEGVDASVTALSGIITLAGEQSAQAVVLTAHLRQLEETLTNSVRLVETQQRSIAALTEDTRQSSTIHQSIAGNIERVVGQGAATATQINEVVEHMKAIQAQLVNLTGQLRQQSERAATPWTFTSRPARFGQAGFSHPTPTDESRPPAQIPAPEGHAPAAADP